MAPTAWFSCPYSAINPGILKMSPWHCTPSILPSKQVTLGCPLEVGSGQLSTERSARLRERMRKNTELLPCVFHPVIQKKSQYCSPAGACREPNLSALVASKSLMASPFPCTKKGKMKKEGFLNSCLGSLTSSFGSAAQRQLVPSCSVFYLKQRCF